MFHKQLKQIMKDRGISQADLVRLTGIGKTSISQYLSGAHSPSFKRKKLIADALEIDMDELEKPIEAVGKTGPKLTPEIVADLLNCDVKTVRADLRSGTCRYGHAVKTSTKWTYIIYPIKLSEITGIKL